MPIPERHVIAVLVVAAALSGCARKAPLGQVDGTVRLDGQPIGNVFVIFQPRDRRLPQSTGLTNDEGHFELRCNDSRKGAVLGEHRVVLVDASRFPAGKDAEEEPLPEGLNAPPSRIPAIYGQPGKSPVEQSVAPGSQTLAIEIRSDGRAS